MQETPLFKRQAPSATAENRFGSPVLKVPKPAADLKPAFFLVDV